MVDLGLLPGGYESFAYSINNNGQIVGSSENGESNGNPPGHYPARKRRAVLWQNGVITDLNTLIPADTGWELTEAKSINDAGQITGIGTLNGERRGFRITLAPAAP